MLARRNARALYARVRGRESPVKPEDRSYT
jgi:hypothetical protein